MWNDKRAERARQSEIESALIAGLNACKVGELVKVWADDLAPHWYEVIYDNEEYCTELIAVGDTFRRGNFNFQDIREV